MKFIKYKNEEEFLKENEFNLLLEEDINNTMLDVASQVEKEKHFFRIENNGKVELVGLITKTERQGLIVYIKDLEITIDVYEFLVDEIISRNIELKEIKAPKGITDIIFDLYSKRKPVTVKSTKKFYLMKLKNPIKIDNTSGTLRKADINDLEIEKNMVSNISSETHGTEITDERACEVAKSLIEKGVYFLTNESREILSQASTTKTTKNGYTIGAVYTPKDMRRKGYARECISSLIQKIKDENKDIIVLYSDIEKIGNRKLYEGLGFEVILEETVIKF